VILLLLLK